MHISKHTHRPMRIGIAAMNFSQLGQSGGLNVYTRQLVEALADFDTVNEYRIFLYDYALHSWSNRTWPANIQLVTLQYKQPARPLLVRGWQRFRRVFGATIASYTDEEFVARQIDKSGVELVHFPATTISTPSTTLPCVLGFSDMQHEYYPQFFLKPELKSRDAVYRRSVSKAAHLIAPSNYTRQTLVEKYEVAGSRLSVVPHGIFKQYGDAVSVEQISNVRMKYNLPDEYIFYPANPWPHKNHARLMAALRLYRQKFGEPPRLVVSGRLQAEVRDVQSLAVAAGVEDCVQDIGFIPVDDLSALYSGALMMVFPSLFEGFGIPLLEAMACGCPIAAANATSIPECVDDAAILFDPFDPFAIADSIHNLRENSTLRSNLKAKGLRRVQHFYWQDIVPQVVAVYSSVCAANQTG